MQQATIQAGAGDLDLLGQHEAALERPCGDAAMQEGALIRVIALPAADDELLLLDGDRQVGLGEPGDRQGDAVGILAMPLDIERRIAVRPGLRHALDQAVELLEAEQERLRGKGYS